ncbi:helix-turn-helix domain-containing protein [Kaistia geumhonensis]|uniref:Transcriptional regulator with XRE-family HTH domain n=1 Tax=Kaistia geumhonensis TaxID=410839 RepID=A0ABU0M8T6_9HYPH|nr:helix-turn-helix domain-containing protein [Kaistia geumhonensis]MCX5477416.1 helix-turn-helix domain-containing protein [Kaistia geumhonensis]MDQ0517377.1 transcriptional regulator with XRE-family HTH domain [Kaistia geumhonensis]
MDGSIATRRHALGDFVRAHRARLQPLSFGLDPGRRRRTPGLRREELAQLAGVSATWLAWIEQGRDVSISAPALARLARAMRLTVAERAYLFGLGGRADPEEQPGEGGELAEGLAAIVGAIAFPAYLIDRTWTARAFNAAAARLFAGWLDGTERNLLRFIFLDPAARRLIRDFETRARRVAAEFRADYRRHLAAPEMKALVADLAAQSPLFAEAWDEQAVVDREGGLRLFDHPVRGHLAFRQTTLQPALHPELKLVVLEPLGSEAQAVP